MSRLVINKAKRVSFKDPVESENEESEESTEELSQEMDEESSEREVAYKVRQPKEDSRLDIGKVELLFPERSLMVGSSGTGKTTLIRHLISRYIKSGKMIQNSTKCVWWFGRNAQSEGLPKGHADSSVCTEKIDRIRSMMKVFPGKYCIIVLDDVLDTQFHGNKWWAQFISSCRHESIILIIGLQYILGIPPTLRNNLSRIYVTSTNNSTRNSLFSLSNNPNQADFRKRMSYVAQGSPALINFDPKASNEITLLNVPRKETI